MAEYSGDILKPHLGKLEIWFLFDKSFKNSTVIMQWLLYLLATRRSSDLYARTSWKGKF